MGILSLFKEKNSLDKVEVSLIRTSLSRRSWDYDVDGNSVLVYGRYRGAKKQDCFKLRATFQKNKTVRFSDERGDLISTKPRDEFFPELKNIMGMV